MNNNRLTQIIGICVLLLVLAFVTKGLFWDKNVNEPSTKAPAVESSTNDLTEAVLEKVFETTRLIWVKLNNLVNPDEGSFLTALGNLAKEKPLIFGGAILLIIGIPFGIYRAVKTKKDRQQRLRVLKESMEEEEGEEEEEDLLDDEEVRPLFPGESVETSVEADDEFEEMELEEAVEPSISDSHLAAKPYEPETEDKETEDKETTSKETEDKETEDEETEDEETEDADDILRKLEQEFKVLEDNMQEAADSSADETKVKQPDAEAPPPAVSPTTDEVLKLDSIDMIAEEMLEKEEAPIASIDEDELENIKKELDKDADKNTEMDQSIIDLQEEMEQTIRELSELVQGDEENPFGGPLSGSLPVKNLHDEIEDQVSQQPELAKESPEIIEETIPDNVIALRPTDFQPAAEDEPPLDPDQARRRINRLTAFQKNLEDQLHTLNLEERPEEELAFDDEAAYSTDHALRSAKLNYEKQKISLEKENSLDLLESFILLANQGKN